MSVRIIVLFLIALSIRSLDTQAESIANGQNNSEACQVIGAIARAQWKSAAPDAPMSDKSFGVDCDWKALGLPQPAITKPGEQASPTFTCSPPVYSADGLQATVNYSYGGDHSAQGHPEQYFYTGSKCMAEKRDGQWRFLGCRMSHIT